MKLRPRLTIFTVSLVIVVVAFTSLSTVFTLRFLLHRELVTSQARLFHNFLRSVQDAVYVGDPASIVATSESLEKTASGLAYAVFVPERGKRPIGAIESRERFKRLKPVCTAPAGEPKDGPVFADDERSPSEKWRVFCRPVNVTTLRGRPEMGTVFLGFNMNILEVELNSIIDRMWATLMWAMLIVLAAGLGVALLLANKITRPILKLTEGAKAIGEGKLDTQIPIESTDELGFLAQEFNWMAVKLRELDQLKDEFVSSVSHELRSPLAAISGYVEFLRSKPIEQFAPEKREKALAIIQENTERLTHFVNDILDLAKLKAGRIDLVKRPFDIRSEADDVFGLFHPLFEKKNIRGTVDVPANVPVIAADAGKVHQVVTNLVSNALKFTPSGGKIRLMARNQNEFVQISVEDSGVGVPDEAKEAIFERFHQLGNAPQGAGPKGTGLGLAIAKGIVESHGGRIWIESELGKGTTVHFTLPNVPFVEE